MAKILGLSADNSFFSSKIGLREARIGAIERSICVFLSVSLLKYLELIDIHILKAPQAKKKQTSMSSGFR